MSQAPARRPLPEGPTPKCNTRVAWPRITKRPPPTNLKRVAPPQKRDSPPLEVLEEEYVETKEEDVSDPDTADAPGGRSSSPSQFFHKPSTVQSSGRRASARCIRNTPRKPLEAPSMYNEFKRGPTASIGTNWEQTFVSAFPCTSLARFKKVVEEFGGLSCQKLQVSKIYERLRN